MLWVLLWDISRRASYATFGAGALSVAVAASGLLTARAMWAVRPAGSRQLTVVQVTWAVPPALAAALLVIAFGWPAWLAGTLGTAAGLAASRAYAHLRREVRSAQAAFPLTADTLAQAELLRAATEAAGSRQLPADNRAMQRLNRAHALVMLAMRDDDYDRLVEALPLLRAIVEDRALHPAVALLAASNLVDAESLLAERGRSGGRYASAIDLFAQLIRENPDLTGQAVLHALRASYHQYQARMAVEDANAQESAADEAGAARSWAGFRHFCRLTERELTTAIKLTARHDPARVQYLAMLRACLCANSEILGRDRMDEGIDLCRTALRLPAGRDRDYRPFLQLSLARNLLMRWDYARDHRDLDESERLLRRLVRLGNPIEARARETLLQIAVLRQEETP